MICIGCGTTEGVNFMGMCEKCYKKSIGANIEETEVTNSNNSNSSNDVADKFILVGTILNIVGYLFAIIIGIVGIIQSGNFWSGIISAIIIAFCVFISTLFYQGIAEIINLLQDIKNK